VYTIGAAAAKIESEIQGAAEIVHAETLDAAVKRASALASPGEVVLLAPACASFDQFQNYEHRGRVFKEVVHALAEQAKEQETVKGDVEQLPIGNWKNAPGTKAANWQVALDH